MNLLASPQSRRIFFGLLYFSEGAPIGYLWWALPTRLKLAGVSITEITALTSLLVLPWTFKFLWAPLVDALQTPRWNLRHWIITAQLSMGATLLPLMWLDLPADFALVQGLLLAHAVAAATQDVAIDALCIAQTSPAERGKVNGWMQSGMLVGRSIFGGGALVLVAHFSPQAVIGLLVAATTCTSVVVALARPQPPESTTSASLQPASRKVAATLGHAVRKPVFLAAVAFALLGGTAFEALGAVQGPLLVDFGFTEASVGWVLAGPNVAMMILGALAGGWLADRAGHRAASGTGLALTIASVGLVGVAVGTSNSVPAAFLVSLLATAAFSTGVFVAATYALFMDLTAGQAAGTQFSALMGATNGCEAFSARAVGRAIPTLGYGWALLAMCAVSLLAAALLLVLKPSRGQGEVESNV